MLRLIAYVIVGIIVLGVAWSVFKSLLSLAITVGVVGLIGYGAYALISGRGNKSVGGGNRYNRLD